MSGRSPTGKTSSRRRPRQTAASSSAVATVCGREATKAALSAPAEAPISRCGMMPLSYSARSMPTCSAQRLAPPDRTNAVRGRRDRLGVDDERALDLGALGSPEQPGYVSAFAKHAVGGHQFARKVTVEQHIAGTLVAGHEQLPTRLSARGDLDPVDDGCPVRCAV